MSAITQSCTSGLTIAPSEPFFLKFLLPSPSASIVQRMEFKSIYSHKLWPKHNTVVISQLWKDTRDDCGKLLCFGEAALGSSRTFPPGFLPLEKGLLLSQSLISKVKWAETAWKPHGNRMETEWKPRRNRVETPPAALPNRPSSPSCIFHIPFPFPYSIYSISIFHFHAPF